MTDIAAAAREFRDQLVQRGWAPDGHDGELAPDYSSDVRVSTGYANGEYTLTALRRTNGSGPARDTIRVRLTAARVQAHPDAPVTLAEDIDFHAGHAAGGWPDSWRHMAAVV